MRNLARLVPIALLFTACGGSQPEPEAPGSDMALPSDSTAAHAKQAEESGEPASPPEAKKDGEKDQAAPEEPKSTRTAQDIVTREGVYYELSFAASDVHQEAEKKCGEKAGDDPKKKADCMSKASQQLETDGLALRQDAEGKWWWYSIRRTGAKMVPVHKIQVEFADDKDGSVTLVPKGRDQGSKPMGRIPDKVVLETPSDSELVVTDPKLGKLVYTAKMGLFGKDERSSP